MKPESETDESSKLNLGSESFLGKSQIWMHALRISLIYLFLETVMPDVHMPTHLLKCVYMGLCVSQMICTHWITHELFKGT